MCQKLCSGGIETSTVLHACLSGCPVPTIRQLLRKAEVDKRKLELVSSEHGSFQDSCKTALYLVCSTCFSRCSEEDRFDKERRCLQIANALLDFGADPNSLNTEIVQIDNRKYSEDTDDQIPFSNTSMPKVVCKRVIEKPLCGAIRSRLAPLVWLLINRGARPECIYMRCYREEFPLKCTKIEELKSSVRKFLLQDRKRDQLILDANDVHKRIVSRVTKATVKARKIEEREKDKLLLRAKKKKAAAKREVEAVSK